MSVWKLGVQTCGVVALLWIAASLSALAQTGEAPPEAGVDRSAELASLRQRVAELELQVRAPTLAVDAAAAVPEVVREREPVDGSVVDTAPIAEQLAGLRRDLRKLIAQTTPEPTRVGGLARGRPADWYQLESFRQFSQQDKEGAKQSLLFATKVDVLSRFGKPTDVYSGDNGDLYWDYERHVEGEVQRVQVVLRDGVVIRVSSR